MASNRKRKSSANNNNQDEESEINNLKRQLKALKYDNEKLRNQQLSDNEKLKNKRQRKEKEPVAISSDDSNSEMDDSSNEKTERLSAGKLKKHDINNSESDQQVLRKLKHHKKISSDSEGDIVNRISKHKTPIAKPPNLKWYDLPKLLALEDKVYASYRSAMHEFVAERWESNTPEYRKLSATKIRSLVKKYKANNPDFPNCIGDWAIKMMMRRSINQQRKVERDATKGSASKEKFNTRNEDISQEDTKSTDQIKVSKKSQLLARNDQQDEQEQNKYDDEPQNTAATNIKNDQQDEEQNEQERNNTDTEDGQQDKQENDNTKSDDTKDNQQDEHNTYDANSREKSNEVLRTRINNRNDEIINGQDKKTNENNKQTKKTNDKYKLIIPDEVLDGKRRRGRSRKVNK